MGTGRLRDVACKGGLSILNGAGFNNLGLLIVTGFEAKNVYQPPTRVCNIAGGAGIIGLEATNLRDSLGS